MSDPTRDRVQRRILLAGIVGMPGAVLTALGLQALFSDQPLHPVLANPDVLWSVIGVGAGFLVWEALILVPALREQARTRARNRG